MAKPRLIILIRHGQSEGNKNREIHQTIPDHRVKLTPEGWAQARDAGRRLRDLLRPDDKLHFFTSPYRRTRETTEGILSTLTSDEPQPSPFRRVSIKVYEEPRLREQDFGNFQPCTAEMERMWQERADYGHFFYRIPNGESAADAYDRVSGFNESLWRQFGEDDFASVCVLVTHGLMSRVFLMKWYHFSVEYFEDLRNINHCEFLIMRKQDNGKFILENKLRTWSELRKERALISKEKEKQDRDAVKLETKLEKSKSSTMFRLWGGCPNGCNHTNHYKKREDLETLRRKDQENGITASRLATSLSGSPARRHRQRPGPSSDEEDSHDEATFSDLETSHILQQIPATTTAEYSSAPKPSRQNSLKNPLLHVGRDFGGTYSGHPSIAGSDTEGSEGEYHRIRRLALLNRPRTTANRGAESAENAAGVDDLAAEGVQVRALANRLGDAPQSGESDSEDERLTVPDDVDKAEKEDRSIEGSVY